ncbi:DUF5977 domain-containing protein [Chryseobacterium sp. MMS23-Vi53]|uniref:DUF5977 domain-containing protein n=1 Tax=Chryseobacterium sp. MMS23-Vi53 TaxID=3386644 RepID=UPI0039EAAD37
MILKNKKLFTISLFLFTITTFGQTHMTTPNAEIKSPQSYAFEKYGNVPVNLYTGAIDLQISITSLDIAGSAIPITLNYDSSGFIPHKKSDAAGMGWSMLAGGRISRTVNGTADEYVGTNLQDAYQLNPYGEAVDLHGFLKGVKSNPTTTNVQAYNLNGGTGSTDGTSWWLGTYPNEYEGEPDEFRFTALGLTGKFMVGNDGNVLVESNDPNIKVDLSGMALYGGKNFCVPPASSTITITDGQGTKYIFGGDLSKYEISYSYSVLPEYPNDYFSGHPVISSFSLSKVIFTNGKEITFNYQQGTLFDDTFCHLNNWDNLRANSKILSMDSFSQDGGRSDSYQQCYAPPVQSCFSSISGQNLLKDTFVMLKKSVLTSIKYLDDEIKINYIDTGYPIKHFTLSPFSANKVFNEWVIDNVETYHKTNLIKKSQLSYDHLGGEFKRPFLKSVTDISSNQTYSFEYYKTGILPAYYTKGIDHWGYWNSKDSNTQLAPLDTYDPATGDYTLNNTFRDAEPQNYDVALLKKIIYPTKGSSVFEYEPQYYGKRVDRISSSAFLPTLTNNGGLAGGARIRKIFSLNENGVASTKEYKYTTSLTNSSSSGILMSWPRYFYGITIDNSAAPAPFINSFILKTSSNVQKNSLDSYNIGYSKVFEIENNKGYTEHNFTTYETHPDIFNPGEPNIRAYNSSIDSYTILTPPNLFQNWLNLYSIDKSVLRGRPISDKFFSQTDFVNPIKTVEYEYYDNMDYNPNNSKDNNNYVTFNHMSAFWVQGYKRFLNSTPTKKITTTDYYGNTQVITKSENIFDSSLNLNLSKTNNTSSENSVIQTNYTYATGSNALVTANLVGIPLIREVKKDGKTISKVETKYENSSPSQLLPSSEISYDVQNPSVNYTNVIYDKYDEKGNLQQYTTQNSISTTIIWGYNKTKPIAKIVGAKLSDIQQSLIDGIVNASIIDDAAIPNNDESSFLGILDNFRNDTSLSNYQITTYTYDPLIGVRSITPPSGIRENYLYDTAKRLNKVVDVNGNILKEYKYKNNPSTMYYNSEQSWVFNNTSCGSNAVGSPFTYTVPAYKYMSIISQVDADQKAQTDINTNGQTIANANSTCTPFSCPISFNSSIGISGTGSVAAVNSNGYYVITLSFTTGPNSTTFQWDEDPGVKIATINGSCRPTYELNSYNTNGDVFYTIKPNGDIYIQSFNPFPNNTPKTYELELYFNN